VPTVEVDATDESALTRTLTGHDVAVTAIQSRKTNHDVLIEAVRSARVPRWFITGGSRTLLTPGTDIRIMDGSDFPAAFLPSARAATRFWARLEQVQDIDRVYLSPPPGIGPGRRTGTYRRGRRELLVRDDGRMPSISYDDYAIAIADELEQPSLVRDRFTVAH
jgi:putative NADH-flavin reductase